MALTSRSKWIVAIGLATTLFVAEGSLVRSGGSGSVVHCGPSGHLTWPSAWAYYHRPSSLTDKQKAAIDGAADTIEANSPFTWYVVAASSGPRLVVWRLDTTSLADTAGGATSGGDGTCNGRDWARAWLGQAHLRAETHTTREIQCIAIHEFGHIMNFTDVTTGSTIMLNPHPTRCHNLLIDALTKRDRDDLEHIY